MRKPSGFDLKTDKDQEPEGIALLLIVGALLVAVVTGGIELVSATGFPVPHAVTMFAGVTIGSAFGFSMRRLIHESTRDH
jgi:hypothetical protein